MNEMNTQSESRVPLLGVALFYGSVWGLGEATLGHLLHLVHVPGLPGLVMFPFGALVMSVALRRSGRAEAAFLAGVVASAFKVLDMIVPGTDPLAVINPVQAILLESAAASVLALFFGRAAGVATPSRQFLSSGGRGGEVD
jgi:hypothetical protein